MAFKTQDINLPSNEEINEAAHNWVFVINDSKWSNNNNEIGDNYGSFINGAKWLIEQLKNK